MLPKPRIIVVTSILAVAICGCGTGGSAPAPRAQFEWISQRGALSFVWIEPAYAKNVDAIKEVIRAVQAQGAPDVGGVQKIILWSDRSLVPDGSLDAEGLPMSEAQADSQVAGFSRNNNNGFTKLLVDGKDIPWP